MIRWTHGRTAVVVPALYAASIGFLFLADVLLARRLQLSDYAEYSLVRSSIPLVSVLTLVGVDQAITRRYAEGGVGGLAGLVMAQRLPTAIIVSLTGGVFLRVVLGTSWWAAGALAAAGLAVALSDLSSAFLRGKGSYVGSALLQQGYRLTWGVALLTAFLLPFLESGIKQALVFAPACAWAVTFAGLLYARPFVEKHQNADVRATNLLGLAFGTSMLSMLLLDWIDQAFLAATTNLPTAGAYAVQRLVAVYPLLSIASIAGFVLMPELIRRSSRLTQGGLRHLNIACVSGSLLLGVLWASALVVLFPRLMPTTSTSLTLVCLALVGALRLYYLVPSSVLGAFGSTALIVRASVLGLASAPLLALVFVGLQAPLGASGAMAVALLVATSFRVLVAAYAASQARPLTVVT